MGIQNLSAYLASLGVVHRPVKMTSLSGRIVAIDAAQFVSRASATAHKRHVNGAMFSQLIEGKWDRPSIVAATVTSVLHDVALILSKGIAPVFVFDGIPMEEKTATKAKRSAARERTVSKEEALRTELMNIGIENVLKEIERLSADATVKRTYFDGSIGELGSTPSDEEDSFTSAGSETNIITKINTLRSLSARTFTRLNNSEMRALGDLLADLGIPVLQAPDEGERMCASLARNGAVDYVMTTDSDALAFGAPRVIRSLCDEVRGSGTRDTMEVIELVDALKALKMDQTQFVDMCILFGNDFNEHIPRVGKARAPALFEEMGRSLDGPLPEKYAKAREGLRIDWCRKFFTEDAAPGIRRADLVPRTVTVSVDVPVEFRWAFTSFPNLIAKLNIYHVPFVDVKFTAQ